jgi:hypothetical protein
MKARVSSIRPYRPLSQFNAYFNNIDVLPVPWLVNFSSDEQLPAAPALTFSPIKT